MITENLSTLKIHRLTEEQYKRELNAGRIDLNALYLTSAEDEDMAMLVVTTEDVVENTTEYETVYTGTVNYGSGAIFDAAQANRKVVFCLDEQYYTLVHYTQDMSYFAGTIIEDDIVGIAYGEIDPVQRFTFKVIQLVTPDKIGDISSGGGVITQEQLDSLSLITVEDIDAICETTIQVADSSGVTF